MQIIDNTIETINNHIDLASIAIIDPMTDKE